MINQIEESHKNPVIYPNQNKETFNILSYIPRLPNLNKPRLSPTYNNKNTRKLIIHNKKKLSKKKPSYHISQRNKN